MKTKLVALALALLITAASAILILTIPNTLALAQGEPQKPVTADQVNEIARQLYCPVCENITLDTCGTAACAQWREEIRLQLEEGKTPQQVIDDFVTRFGDRVVGTPVDPTLRALSLITPWLLGSLAVLVAVWYLRKRDKDAEAAATIIAPDLPDRQPLLHNDDEYRARLEQDLARLR
ncbi:MAG: cytochrome c-type biogenesis protein CcmH [Anaerolineae bacterium]|nr:cytochrome c-type biogenesis protein CcmH [Anaerolineae bacterium]